MPVAFPFRTALALLCLLGTATPARAQTPDSARVLRAARSAQATFERVRQRHLPWTWSASSGPCDERIGRFCLTHEDDRDDSRPPPEPDAVRRARAKLTTHLDGAAVRHPGDEWIAGQRVRYHAEAGRFDLAAAAAAECRAAEWWCLALAGYARHAAGEWTAADSLFDAALQAMPPGEYREWTDLSLLLDEPGWRPYRRGSAVRRDSLERRFWWLADPLWMEPGNDRRTEHFARHVLDRLQDRARSAEGVRWGSDLRELLLRYGWPVGWEQVRTGGPMQGLPPIVGHYAPRARRFDPPVRVLGDPLEVDLDEWDLDPDRPRTEYLPRYAARFDPLQHQLARFRRGDSVVLVVAYDLREDSVPPPAGAVTRAALVVAAEERATPAVATSRSGAPHGALHVTVPAAPTVLSVEARMDSKPARALRARYGLRLVPPPAGISVSDLLLVDSDALPRSLEEAIASARGSATIRPGKQIGLYWEVYGPSPATGEFAVSLGIEQVGGGWLRQVGERIGIADRPPATRLGWRERPGDGPSRSLTLRIPDLPPGSYLLTVTLTPDGERPVAASRRLEVRR